MESSETLNELAAALAKAQGEVTGALKDSANPFFKSKYADLASCWDACRSALSKNGLAVTQFPTSEAGTSDIATYLETTLLHSSGQWMRSKMLVRPLKDTPQDMGSALTYARRYALTAVVGVAQVDDDGNAASGRQEGHSPKGDAVQSVPTDTARKHALAMLGIIAAPAKDGDHDELQKALDAYDYHQKHLQGNNDLYIAAAEQMETPKRTAWKALINKAKAAEAADKAVSYAGRRW